MSSSASKSKRRKRKKKRFLVDDSSLIFNALSTSWIGSTTVTLFTSTSKLTWVDVSTEKRRKCPLSKIIVFVSQTHTHTTAKSEAQISVQVQQASVQMVRFSVCDQSGIQRIDSCIHSCNQEERVWYDLDSKVRSWWKSKEGEEEEEEEGKKEYRQHDCLFTDLILDVQSTCPRKLRRILDHDRRGDGDLFQRFCLEKYCKVDSSTST